MNELLAYFDQYPWLALVAWGLVSGILNMLLRKKTAEEWVALGEDKPRLAAVIRVLRAVGFDPAKLINALSEFLNAKAAPGKEKLLVAALSDEDLEALDKALQAADPKKDDPNKDDGLKKDDADLDSKKEKDDA